MAVIRKRRVQVTPGVVKQETAPFAEQSLPAKLLILAFWLMAASVTLVGLLLVLGTLVRLTIAWAGWVFS